MYECCDLDHIEAMVFIDLVLTMLIKYHDHLFYSVVDDLSDVIVCLMVSSVENIINGVMVA